MENQPPVRSPGLRRTMKPSAMRGPRCASRESVRAASVSSTDWSNVSSAPVTANTQPGICVSSPVRSRGGTTPARAPGSGWRVGRERTEDSQRSSVFGLGLLVTTSRATVMSSESADRLVDSHWQFWIIKIYNIFAGGC